MGPPRIVVGPLPGLLRDLVCALASVTLDATAPDSLDALLDEAERRHADVVVASIAVDADAARASHVLAARVPGAALVNVDARGARAARYENGRIVATGADLSADGLRALLRGA